MRTVTAQRARLSHRQRERKCAGRVFKAKLAKAVMPASGNGLPEKIRRAAGAGPLTRPIARFPLTFFLSHVRREACSSRCERIHFQRSKLRYRGNGCLGIFFSRACSYPASTSRYAASQPRLHCRAGKSAGSVLLRCHGGGAKRAANSKPHPGRHCTQFSGLGARHPQIAHSADAPRWKRAAIG